MCWHVTNMGNMTYGNNIVDGKPQRKLLLWSHKDYRKTGHRNETEYEG